MVNNITVIGEDQPLVSTLQSPGDALIPQRSFLIGNSIRGTVESHTVTLDEDNVIELVFEDDTTWLCNTDTLAELFPEAPTLTRSGKETFVIPFTIKSETAERGIVSDIALKLLNVFTRKEVGNKIKSLAEDLENKQLETATGLFRIDQNFQLQKFAPEQTDKPWLLFLHGTASSTKGSFSKLAEDSKSGVWGFIKQNYGSNIIAYQHRTLTESPLKNVLELVKAIPQHATLDLISHSRGGLIGEILSRFCNCDERNSGFTEAEITLLKKENRTEEVALIADITTELRNKKILIRKFIRVACPAGGTTLASGRLDNFFNVAFNLVGIGAGVIANPVYVAFRNLLSAIISTKDDTEVLPGIEAMNPESPFIKVLNNPNNTIDADHPLIIISGNCKAKVNLRGLVVLASKLFYTRNNDLIVDTSSMYRGTRRKAAQPDAGMVPVQYFFYEGTDVDHFEYFRNASTSGALLLALQSENGKLVQGFQPWTSASAKELERNALLNLDGGQVFQDTVTGSRPIAVLLPGIMGSNLEDDSGRIWIEYYRMISGQLERIGINESGVKATSLVATSYAKIVRFLSARYDVVTFSFDWRVSLHASAKDFSDKIDKLLEYKQPVKVIAHSMGGVLFRDFMLTQTSTWDRLNESTGFQAVFLGSPLGGSFRIPAVLMGIDPIIRKLSMIDIVHTKPELVGIFSRFPGLLNLLPLTNDADNDFAQTSTWEKMRDALGDKGWPVPDKSDLDTFGKYRDNILSKLDNLDYSRISYVAGRDKATFCGYRIEQKRDGKELVFLSTAEGDQSVTWDSGIPRKMSGTNAVYFTNVSHGSLANDDSLFKGITEILEQGSTNLLGRNRPAERGEVRSFILSKEETFDLSPSGIEMTLLGIDGSEKLKTGELPINVTVSQGDLKYATYPVLAGHFAGDGILYAERAINGLLNDALEQRLQLGFYPGEIGTSEGFISSEPGGFKGAIIVGLGTPGTLTAFMLTRTVEQGVSRFLLNLNSKHSSKHYASQTQLNGITSLAIASGYGGLTIASSIRAIIQGVSNANDKIRTLFSDKARLMENIEFIEQYEDRALSCYHVLNRIQNEDNRPLNILVTKRINKLLGSKQRLASETGEEWWNRITVRFTPKDPDAADSMDTLHFSSSTGGAREEQRDLYTSIPVIEGLLKQISSSNRWTSALARTVFELLIPNDFKDQVKRQNNINWILDKRSAAYPWELLQDSAVNARPLCVNAGMIRQLTTQNYRLKINAVVKDTALVIADPDLQGFAPQLSGAEQEGVLVNQQLRDHAYDTTYLPGATAPEIVEALFKDDYKIIHLAGHGIFKEDAPGQSGMAIGKHIFLTPFEICQMSTTPELVFVNCCYLGQMNGVAEEYYQSRYKLAANIGTQLIENGVKAVVVAGWAVDDNAALDFTREFYQGMFAGDTFGEAIHHAREVIYQKYQTRNNTWGAYQCYGDPFYTLRPRADGAKTTTYSFIIAEEAEIELYNLRNELDMGNYSHLDLLNRVAAISKAVDDAGIRNAAITELEALIYADMYEFDLAILKFENLTQIENASFTFSAMEKYCNVRAKKCIIDFKANNARRKELQERMEEVIRDLEALIQLGSTAERYTMLGSTYKRKALLSTTSQKMKAYQQAAAYFYMADGLKNNTYKAYTLTNWLVLTSLMVLLNDKKWGDTVTSGNASYILPDSALTGINKLLDLKTTLMTGTTANMDYWQLLEIATIELGLIILKYVAGTPAASWDDLLNAYKNTWNKAGSKGKRMGEIEYYDFLMDAVSPLQDTTLKEMLEKIKIQLEKMI
ncbi:CHAT domain-containing protein [Chitinophaga tropicalis]|uniref:CHAT domain-containing protein n=1 Tax=Chitinophaga tropicalis TaxID=2683588 RepID=A0A7K1U0P7_9BACT|nr:CHAT domain-containing protein [Chitinophaga tropicalis]MVT07941.1 CHAT domain-containing protein [Chitinophaga tropicalis]